MNESGKISLQQLQEDYTRITETSFRYFFCPILFRDEETQLCKGHIVNQAFGNSHSDWIIQRKDVDNFYGSNFEADFVGIQHTSKQLSDFLSEKALFSLFRPKITHNGRPVDYYIPTRKSNIPESQTQIKLETEVNNIKLNLKISKGELEQIEPGSMEISIEKDMTLSAVVSLLKAAHLTLFKMLKYQYALTATGHYMGKTILGDFFINNHHENRETVLKNAVIHFETFSHLVRPMVSHTPELNGTIRDNQLYILETSTSTPWAFMIFVRTEKTVHAVIVPIFEHPDGISKFFNFLNNQGGNIIGKFSFFENGIFRVHTKSSNFHWPRCQTMY